MKMAIFKEMPPVASFMVWSSCLILLGILFSFNRDNQVAQGTIHQIAWVLVIAWTVLYTVHFLHSQQLLTKQIASLVSLLNFVLVMLFGGAVIFYSLFTGQLLFEEKIIKSLALGIWALVTLTVALRAKQAISGAVFNIVWATGMIIAILLGYL